MKKLLVNLVLLLTISLFSTHIAYASHYAGGTISTQCIGGNNYEVTYTFYRDCSGINIGIIDLHASCQSNSSINFTVSMTAVPGTGQNIVPICSSYLSYCDGGNIFGIEEHVYTATVSLPPCADWTLYTSSCCRNNVTTISSANQFGWKNMLMLDNQNASNNSTPVFNFVPQIVLYTNQSTSLNVSASDVDGDLLIYSLVTPFTDTQAPLSYNTPYSYTNFLASYNGITLDSLTGIISFTPTAVLTTIFCVKVDEYRNINGVSTKIGTIYRDVQLDVVNGTNTPPVLSGFSTGLSYNPNDTLYTVNLSSNSTSIGFSIYGFDADTFNAANTGSPEKYRIIWDTAIAGAVLLAYNNGTDSAMANFFWTPTALDTNDAYYFNVSVIDSACPYNGVNSYRYKINFAGYNSFLGFDRTLCKGDIASIKSVFLLNNPHYSWSINGVSLANNPSQDSLLFNSSNFPSGTNYVTVIVDDGNTPPSYIEYDTVEIEVVDPPIINGVLNDTAFCFGDSVVYDAGPGYSYKWMIDTSSVPIGYGQTKTIFASGTYTILVNAGANISCFDIDTFDVITYPKPLAFSLGNDTTIANNQMLVLTMPITGYPNYLWSTGATSQYIIVDSNYSWSNPIIGTSWFVNQCPTSDTINVFIGSTSLNKAEDIPLRIYPNPVRNTLNIELEKMYNNSSVEILDLTGKLLSKTQFSGQSIELKNLDYLSKGVYVLRVKNKDLNVIVQFVKE